MSLNGTFTGVFSVASIGLMGLLMGGNKPKKQYLGEISKQTAKEAEPRVIVYGRVRPIGGNLMYCQEPVKRFVKQKVEGGKGGGSKKQEQKVENVFRTYAMGVCEGPITGFMRIWRNNKLVYDARGNAWGIKNNPVFLKSFKLYLGGWDQMPSPYLEKIWGVGNVPAHRGTAFIVAVDENLTETNGMVPQWIFEVERAEGVFVTSQPYAIEDIEEAGGAVSLQRLRNPEWRNSNTESLTGSVAVSGMSFRNTLHKYSEVESISGAASLQSMNFRSQQEKYTYSEEINGSAILYSMKFRLGLIRYRDPAGYEALNGSVTLRGLKYGLPS